MEFMQGFPIPLRDVSKVMVDTAPDPVMMYLTVIDVISQQDLMKMAVFNDTQFLSSIQVVDYSILMGIDADSHQLVIGIIGNSYFCVCCDAYLTYGVSSPSPRLYSPVHLGQSRGAEDEIHRRSYPGYHSGS